MLQKTGLAVVSHDAGGAEILSSYIKREALHPIYVLEGPSRKIFERKLGTLEVVSLEQGLQQATSILCGTSWQSDLEFNAIKHARALGKSVVAFIDHWVNYKERFIRSGETCLPNEIWVGDPVAEAMAKDIFPGHPIILEKNPYFEDIQDQLASFGAPHHGITDETAVLYVCEPVREHAKLRHGNERYWGYTEEEALRYFLRNISALGRKVTRIQIRPHPSEPKEKYKWVQDEFFSLPIVAGGTDTLLAEIVASDVVVGCESMAMVIGLFAGKRVISSIPRGGRACVLPHKGIEHLQNLIY